MDEFVASVVVVVVVIVVVVVVVVVFANECGPIGIETKIQTVT